VPFDPADSGNRIRLSAFRTHYGLTGDVAVAGGYQGQLDNDSELLQLRRPGNGANEPGAEILMEEIVYDNVLPWPPGADGTGKSLTRTAAGAFGNDAASWQALSPSPGRTPGSGDVNMDGVANVGDIDFVCASLDDPATAIDLNGDGQGNADDYVFLIEALLGSVIGDANLDGTFNSSDFVLVFQASEYEDRVPSNSTWAEGDWNCDRDFTTFDLVLAFQKGAYVARAKASQGAVPRDIDRAALASLAMMGKGTNAGELPMPERRIVHRDDPPMVAGRNRTSDARHDRVRFNLDLAARDLIFEGFDRRRLEKVTSETQPRDEDVGSDPYSQSL
jgi:hypothetical protein